MKKFLWFLFLFLPLTCKASELIDAILTKKDIHEIQAIVDEGANINEQDNKMMTPLMYAIGRYKNSLSFNVSDLDNSKKVIYFLIEKGADKIVNVKNSSIRAIDMCSNCEEDVIDLLRPDEDLHILKIQFLRFFPIIFLFIFGYLCGKNIVLANILIMFFTAITPTLSLMMRDGYFVVEGIFFLFYFLYYFIKTILIKINDSKWYKKQWPYVVLGVILSIGVIFVVDRLTKL